MGLLIFLFLSSILMVFVIFIGVAGGIFDIFYRIGWYHVIRRTRSQGMGFWWMCRDYFFSDRRDRFDDTILDIW